MRNYLCSFFMYALIALFAVCGGCKVSLNDEGESADEAEEESEGECSHPAYGCNEQGESCSSSNNCVNALRCIFETCDACTLELAEQEIAFCDNPDNRTSSAFSSYCSAMPDDCPGSNGGCPCCPSTGPLGCVFVERSTDVYGDPLAEDAQITVTIEGFAQDRRVPPFLIKDIPTGTYPIMLEASGYCSESVTIEVDAGKTVAFGASPYPESDKGCPFGSKCESVTDCEGSFCVDGICCWCDCVGACMGGYCMKENDMCR